MLLQKGVVPELKRRGIQTVYLNLWRGDWAEAPARILLKELGGQTSEHPCAALGTVLENAQNAVVILDQFDEFQISHRDRFMARKVITRADLESANPFFQILNTAIRRGRICCVYVSRQDVEWGKRVVLLEDAPEIYLRRLPKAVVQSELTRVIPDDAVDHPENGWIDLRETLCNDLSSGGVLPVQMRFAVLGLEALKQELTTAQYLRYGRAQGLVARHVETEVQIVAGSPSVARHLFQLLNDMTSPDGKSTIPVPEDEILKYLPEVLGAKVLDAFLQLENETSSSGFWLPQASSSGASITITWRSPFGKFIAANRRSNLN